MRRNRDDEGSELGECEEIKLCGIYSTHALAEAARIRLLSKSGFRDWPGGFQIDEYRVDQDCWTDGFISTDEAD
jgi:hypothetical protein